MSNLEFLWAEDDPAQTAVISDDSRYRYLLTRRWAMHGKTVGFICLNPSTADASSDDPTVRKCVRMAKRWGGAKLLIANLFAFRSTDPANLHSAIDPVGPENDEWLSRVAAESDILVAAWGTNGALLGRNDEVAARFCNKLHALRLTKDGHPSHPLYLPEGLPPFRWPLQDE